MRILPDVYWIKGGGSNFYLCLDKEGLSLIDAGLPRREHLVWQAIKKVGRQPSDLKRIFITHADIDHVGSLAAVQGKTGAVVLASSRTATLLSSGQSPEHMPWLAQAILNRFIKYKPIFAVRVVADGDVLPVLGGLHVLATPGHTLDHHAFYAPTSGILFAGDALNTRNGRLQRTPKRITADENAANRSAIRLLELSPSVFACGHGQPMSGHSNDDLMMLFNACRNNLSISS